MSCGLTLLSSVTLPLVSVHCRAYPSTGLWSVSLLTPLAPPSPFISPLSPSCTLNARRGVEGEEELCTEGERGEKLCVRCTPTFLPAISTAVMTSVG